MSDSSSLQEQYKQLRTKIDAKVKHLQGKLIDQNKTSASCISHCPVHGNQHNKSHCSRHPHQQNYNHYLLNLDRQSNLMQVSSRMTQQYQAANNSIADALRENIKVQKQMSQNLKILSDRVLDMSQPSNYSGQIQESNLPIYGRYPTSQRQNNLLPNQSQNLSRQQTRSLKNFSRSHSNLQIGPRKFNRKSRQRQFLSRSKMKAKIPYIHTDRSTNNHFQQQYFALKCQKSPKCPKQEAKKMKSKVSKRKKSAKHEQIYKDSLHRTKKHEKDHLLNSYHQHEKSRKQLLAKIARNFVNNSQKKL